MATYIWLGGDSANPNDWDTAANWSPSGPPVTDDDVIITGGRGANNRDYDILDGLDQSAVDLVTLRIDQSYTGLIGLKTSPLVLGARAGGTTIDIGLHDGTGSPHGSGRINIQLDADEPTTVNIHNSASRGTDLDLQPIRLTGGDAAGVLTVRKGIVGLATTTPSDTFLCATLNIGYIDSRETDAQVVCGKGVTVTTVNKAGGSLLQQAAGTITTVTNNGGTYRKLGAQTITTFKTYQGSSELGGTGAVTGINQHGGTTSYTTTGTITNLNLLGGSGTTMGSNAARTITTVNMYAGSSLEANVNAVTFTNGIVPFERQEITFVRV